MNSSALPTDSEIILARFVLELEDAGAGQAILAAYQAEYPALATRLAGLAATRGLVDQAAGADELPPRLGDSRLLERVAAGGMGQVYLAEEERLKRRVAVKIIHRHLCLPEYYARFVREQQVLARLHHTDIVPILAAGEVGPFEYFAMPYIEGATLQHVQGLAQQPSCWPAGTAPDLSTLARLWRCGQTPVAPETVVLPGRASRAAPPPESAPPPKLSRAYFRSVAEVLASAADALHHAHEQGIVHRDIKPSNLMVARDDKGEKCWVIDFGLAGFGRMPEQTAEVLETSAVSPAVSGIMGTPAYMAPEQWTAPSQVDARTDVWGLGATLYQLLTLRPAFSGATPDDVRRQVLSVTPLPPRQRLPSVPADLEAVCLHTLHKELHQRYPTAHALAADLRACVRGEPPSVARHYRWRQAAWHARQHQGLVAVAAALVLVVLGALAGWGLLAKAQAEAAQREALILQAQQLHLGERAMGWSAKAWAHVRAAAALRADDTVRREAAATLAGLDAHEVKTFKHGASSVAFDRTGTRLLMGGLARQTARLWDRARATVTDSGRTGAGPVAFRADGTPVQLVADPDTPGTLLLWDVAGRQLIRRFVLPAAARPTKSDEVLLALAPEATWLAAAVPLVEGKGAVFVWDTSGKLIKQLDHRLSALAFSLDGTLLAGGAEDGRITVWTLSGNAAPITLHGERASVWSLALAPDPLRRLDDAVGRRGGLLAAGCAGGAITIWDLHTRQARAFCPGSAWDVYALAFSPDGMTLASGGRTPSRLWDAATGRLLLLVPGGDWTTALAFTPDGRKLAGSTDNQFNSADSATTVLALEPGRGLHTLRGLVRPTARICFSPDDRLVAAVAHDWQVAIWDVAAGRLRHVLEAPPGLTADNAGMAFDAQGTRFAFVAGTQARLWDLDSGRSLATWDLPPGLASRLAFQPDGSLLLARLETADGKPPYGEFPWTQHPRVCPLRRLTAARPPERLAEITTFNRHVTSASLTADGRYLVIEGLGGPDGKRHAIVLFAGRTGKELHTLLDDHERPRAVVALDPTGTLVSFSTTGQPDATLVVLASGQVLGRLDGVPAALGPGAKLIQANDANGHYSLLRRLDGARLVQFAPSVAVHPPGPFNTAGTCWSCGHPNGAVLLCDLPELNRRLSTLGLGW